MTKPTEYNDSLFKGIFNTALDAIITINDTGEIEAFNPKAIQLFGYEPEEVIGKNVNTLMPEPYAHEHSGYLKKYLKTSERKIIGLGREVVGKHKDGSVFPMHLSVNEATLEGRTVFIGFVRDISDVKATEKKLTNSEKSAFAILNTAVDGIATINTEGILQSVNHAMTKLFLYSEQELIGQSVTMLMPEPYASNHDSYIKNYLKTGEERVIGIGRKVLAQRKNGLTFPMFLSVSEFTLDGEIFFAGIIRDITEQTETELYLSVQKNKLEQLNKEQESFSYSVSHDLRAPLRHIIGYIGLLNKKLDSGDQEKVSHYAKTILNEANRMNHLIESLLNFSRIGRASLKKQYISFNALIQDIINDYKVDAADRVISWEIMPLPKVYCDESMLRLVWENLISNALKFTQKKEKSVITISVKQSEDEFTFSIQDNGAGFNQKYVGKLFGVFQRLHADSEFEGTGIGLSNIQKIILKHGGKVWIEGKIDQGATAFFSLPIQK